MKEKWDDRYSSTEFAYGEQPNNYLKEQLIKIPAGTILFPAEGEGRNAVYAATLGWKAYAFDISVEGKKKAMQLANKNNVDINYEVAEFQSLKYQLHQFDAMALIYAHFPADVKSGYHKTLTTYLRPGGVVIFEAFSKKHLDYVTKNEEIQSDFENFEIIELTEQEVQLNEGLYHIGNGSVLRFVGRKK
jgi:2-polyprenyl-3-methyl-5-hydroxy-6-metoxy-1,4-benzoquinol methylase